MRSEFMGEDATLTALFGEDVDQDILDVSIESGIPVSVVRKAVSDYAPELLGEELGPYYQPGGAPAEKKGVTIAKSIIDAIGQAAPGVVSAIKGSKGGSSYIDQQEQPEGMTLEKMIIPAGIGLAILFLLLRKK